MREVEPPAALLFSDPDREPIRAVDQITFHRSRTAHLDITCCAQVPVARSATEWDTESVVTARPRMDLAIAAQIAMLEGAARTKN